MDELIAKTAPVLRAGPALRLAVLFGSFATGKAHPGSDVDIAILPRDPGLPLRAELGLASAIASAVGREVDIVRLDLGSALLRWQVAKHGVLVFEEPGEWTRFRVREATAHADIADAHARAQKLFIRHLLRTAH